MICRFAVLNDDRGLILGVDAANVFEKGVVYEAFDFDGEIILRKLGRFSLNKDGRGGVYPNGTSDNQAIIRSGYHLLTQEEYDKLCEKARK